MRRRHFCTAAGAGCLGSLAGCTALDLPFGGPDGHPFADSTVAVRIEDRGETAHDVSTVAQEALDFWAAESRQYVEFDIEFELVEEQPDLVVAFVDTPEDCTDVENYSSDVLGCAPLVRPGNRINRPLTAFVVAADRPYGSVRTTAKHEIGHVLGLGHDDEPRQIMSNRPEDRIRLFSVRTDIWEAALAAHDQHNTASRKLNDGIAAWNDERYTDAVEIFEAADDAFAAASSGIQTALDGRADLETDPPLETVDYETLESDLGTRAERLAIGSEISTIMAEASQTAADGRESTARERLSEGNELLDAFRAVGWAEIRTVAVALGLVRGFDHLEDGVAIEEDEI